LINSLFCSPLPVGLQTGADGAEPAYRTLDRREAN
jgi:hypothetical protein